MKTEELKAIEELFEWHKSRTGLLDLILPEAIPAIRSIIEENGRMREALQTIRDWDYRGNRHPTSGIARDSLGESK